MVADIFKNFIPSFKKILAMPLSYVASSILLLRITKSHSLPFTKTYLILFKALEDTNDNNENVALDIINKITRSLKIVPLCGTGINKLFEIQLNLLFWSANFSDHLQRKYLQISKFVDTFSEDGRWSLLTRISDFVLFYIVDCYLYHLKHKYLRL